MGAFLALEIDGSTSATDSRLRSADKASGSAVVASLVGVAMFPFTHEFARFC